MWLHMVVGGAFLLLYAISCTTLSLKLNKLDGSPGFLTVKAKRIALFESVIFIPSAYNRKRSVSGQPDFSPDTKPYWGLNG